MSWTPTLLTSASSWPKSVTARSTIAPICEGWVTSTTDSVTRRPVLWRTSGGVSDFIKCEACVGGDREIERKEGGRQQGAEQDQNLHSEARSHDDLLLHIGGVPESGPGRISFVTACLVDPFVRAALTSQVLVPRGFGTMLAVVFGAYLTLAEMGAVPEAATPVVAVVFVVSLAIRARRRLKRLAPRDTGVS